MVREKITRNAVGVVIACAVGNFFSATPMVNSLFGVFLKPISEAFHWPRSLVSLSLTIVAGAGVLAYPLAGRLADRIGVRRVVLVGNLLFAGAIFSLSFIPGQLIGFYLLFLGVGLTAALPSTVLYSKAVTGWFHQRRGVMLGLTAGLGNGAGSTIMPIIASMLVFQLGWRGAYQALALIIVIVGFPTLFLLLRDAPKTLDEGQELSVDQEGLSLRDAVRTPTFLIMVAAIGVGAGGMTAVFAHVIPILSDEGVPIALATGVLVSFALAATVWQVIMGWLLDRVPTPSIAAPFFLIALFGMMLIVHGHDPKTLVAGGLLAGVGLGTEYGLLPYWVPRYFGRRAYGAIYGFIYGAIVLIMGITPFLMDAVFDATRSYDLATDSIAGVLVAGAGLVFVLKPYVYDSTGRLISNPSPIIAGAMV